MGISIRTDRIWVIDYNTRHSPKEIAEQTGYLMFSETFWTVLSASRHHTFRTAQLNNRIRALEEQINHLHQFIEAERRACWDWQKKLNRFYDQISQALIQNESKRFTQRSRDYLRSEVGRLFIRHDVLAIPRKMIKQILLLPFSFLGFRKAATESKHQEALRKFKERFDISSVEAAVEVFNRSVFENLSPQSKHSPLYRELRRPGVVLEQKEIQKLTRQEQEHLTEWIQDTFQELSQGLPRGTRWGIYSTSILWGILLLSLETAVGGGFTMLDAVLDAALAPFITKGTVELFAYQEIQKITRDLSNRYRKMLLAALQRQLEQYRRCLESLEPTQDTFDSLSQLRASISRFTTDNPSSNE